MIQQQGSPKKSGGAVFISYAHADEGLARQLAQELRKAHFEPWLADDAVAPGDNVAKRVGKALEASYAIVFLVSKDALRSPGVKHEWDYAISSPRHAGRVLPVLTPGTKIESVPWIMKHINPVRATADWKRAARSIVSTLRKLAKTG